MPGSRLPWFVLPFFASATALAQPESPPAASPAPATDAAPDDEPPLPLVPPAHDTLGGHFVVGLGAALEAPFGDLRDGDNAANLGPGLGGALDLGFGLSRSVVLGAWGTFSSYGSDGTGYAVGPFVRYHLVQGVRFDPWLLAGAGYRSLERDVQGQKQRFAGIELLHLVVGGDYYPLSNFGFGPFLELDVGIYGTRPKNVTPEQPNGARVAPAVHLGFAGGLRLVLDLPGK
jgi:hypothetical protein